MSLLGGDKINRLYLFIFLFLLFLIVPINALNVSISTESGTCKNVNGKYYVVKGSKIGIVLSGNPNENIEISIIYKFNINSFDGKYNYTLKKFPIPVDIRSVIIKTYPVCNLYLDITEGPSRFLISLAHALNMLPKQVNADKNGIATISINKKAEKGEYTIEISGNTNNTVVTVEAIIKASITLDNSGKYTITYDTSKLPIGNMTVNANGVSIKAYVVGSESEIPSPTPITTTPEESETESPTITVTTTPPITTTVTVTSVTTVTTIPTVTTPVMTTTPITITTTATQVTTTVITTPITTTPVVTTTEAITRNISVTIEPKRITASGGENVTVNVTINWIPKDEKYVNILVLFLNTIYKTTTIGKPPITVGIPIKIPNNIPAGDYKLTVKVVIDNTTKTDNAIISIKRIPGFDLVLAAVAIVLVTVLRIAYKK